MGRLSEHACWPHAHDILGWICITAWLSTPDRSAYDHTLTLEPHDGIHGKISKVLLVPREDLAAQRRLGDVHEVPPEQGGVTLEERDTIQLRKRGTGAAPDRETCKPYQNVTNNLY